MSFNLVNIFGAGGASTAKGILHPPIIDEVTFTGDQIVIDFLLPRSHNGWAITSYEYQLKAGGAWVDTGSTSQTITTPSQDTSDDYVIRVRAVNALGSGKPSAAENFSFPTASEPTITSIDEKDTVLTINFDPPADDGGFAVTDYEYELNDSGTWVSIGQTTSPFDITGLTNGQLYSVRLRAITSVGAGDASDSEAGVPGIPGAPDKPTIDWIGEGDGQMYVVVSFGDDGGDPVTDVEYRLNTTGDPWQSSGQTSSPIIISLANGDSLTDTWVRAVNVNGESPASNMVRGRAQERIDLETYLALDTSLHDARSNTSFANEKASGAQVVYESGIAGGEAWEGNSLAGGFGSIIKDHEGNLRFYYEVRSIGVTSGTDGSIRSLALLKSTDGGATWDPVRENKNQTIVNDAQSNLIGVTPPGAFNPEDLRSPSVMLDENAPASERYKLVCQFDGDYYIGVSSEAQDGLEFDTLTKVMDEFSGDNSPSSLVWDEKNSQYVIYGREREPTGQFAPDPIPDEGPPRPHLDRRKVFKAVSATWNGTYTGPTEVLDPATEFGYGDDASFVASTNGCSVDVSDPSDGTEDWWESDANTEIRRDIYRGTVNRYRGQFIGTFPVYERNDARVPYYRPDRTTGPIIPQWGHSQDQDNWNMPFHGAEAVDLSFSPAGLPGYLRQDTSTCHSNPNVSETGQLMSAFPFAVLDDEIFVAVLNRPSTHYETLDSNGVPSNYSDYDDDNRYLAIQKMTVDRFASLINTTASEGSWRAKQVKVPDDATQLLINADAGTVKAEILNAITQNVVPGFEKANFEALTGGGANMVANWTTDAQVSDLAGQNVHVKVYMQGAKVYSFRFSDVQSFIDDETYVDSVEDLLAVSSPSEGDPVYVKNFYSDKAGGGHRFFYDPDRDKYDHNGVNVLDPDHTVTPGATGWWTEEQVEGAATGCWIAEYSPKLNIRAAGAHPENATNYEAIQACLNIQGALDENHDKIPKFYDKLRPSLDLDIGEYNIGGSGQLRGGETWTSAGNRSARGVLVHGNGVNGTKLVALNTATEPQAYLITGYQNRMEDFTLRTDWASPNQKGITAGRIIDNGGGSFSYRQAKTPFLKDINVDGFDEGISVWSCNSGMIFGCVLENAKKALRWIPQGLNNNRNGWYIFGILTRNTETGVSMEGNEETDPGESFWDHRGAGMNHIQCTNREYSDFGVFADGWRNQLFPYCESSVGGSEIAYRSTHYGNHIIANLLDGGPDPNNGNVIGLAAIISSGNYILEVYDRYENTHSNP